MTGTELVERALRTIGVLGSGQTVAGEDSSDAFDLLNEMVDHWATQRWLSHFTVRTVKTLAASTASYTIGTGGSINLVRPVSIDRANLIIDSSGDPVTEIPLQVLTDQEWQAVAQKDLESTMPSAIYYDNGWTAGLGKIYPWPVPNVGTTQLVLYTPQAVAQFADLATDYTFPPGYERALRLNLARELAGHFGAAAQWSAKQDEMANDALADVKRTNYRPLQMECATSVIGGAGVPYNIYSDQ